MVCKINCAAIIGIEVQPVMVETDVCNGLPAFDMVGLLASDIKESRERVRTAIKNSGFLLPPKRITINFSPANIRKTGTYFDLPIAVSILQALGVIQCNLADKMFIGELSLNGDVVSVNGVLPIVLCAMEENIHQCFVPVKNVGECDFLENIQVIGIENLNQLVMLLHGQAFDPGMDQSGSCKEDINASLFQLEQKQTENKKNRKREFCYDFKEIKGQIQARRGAEIAAAGMHNMLMIGPPGTGKSAIAKAIPSILPDMLPEEQIEISKIQSIAGLLNGSLVTERPFRSPHYTATVSAMTGGGINPKPGEITLANGGILYMDEFPEFSRGVLEMLRQPMEERQVVVSRAGGSFTFPADFMLVASMNPCKCGYYPDRNKCSCTERDVKKYLQKISGPIVDRIDLCVQMNPVAFGELKSEQVREKSREIKKRVDCAVQIQHERYQNDNINFNGQLSGKDIEKYCPLGKKERSLMEQIYEKFCLSVRGYEKIIKVARTLADLKDKKEISTSEIAEAISFRKVK
ncbi:MAG: YifB family Mg chelatase-like AAA ATPase [Eubacterium sp.]